MTHTIFTADFFKNNRRRLKVALNDDMPIFIAGNGLMQRNRDNTYPFRQNSSFWYLTGCDEPNAWAIIESSQSMLVLPKRKEVHIIFDGQVDTVQLQSYSGVDSIIEEPEAWKYVEKMAGRYKTFAALAPYKSFDGDHGMYSNGSRARLLAKLKSIFSNNDYKDIRPALMNLRFIKQPVEIQAIRDAVDATTEAFLHVQKNITDYTFEYEVEADMTRIFKRKGLDHAYPPIIASGKNACTMHHFLNNSPLRKGDVILLDVGAEAHHYAADISRTFTIGTADSRKQEVIKAVADIATYATSLLKPGVSFYDIHTKLYDMTGEKLKELGLVKKITKKNIMRYNPTASHFLGLDVHDVGDYHRLLQEGVVLTIEPGIYIPEESIGVRIEDDVLITATGSEILSKKLPKHFVAD